MGTQQVLRSWKESLSLESWWSTASGDWKPDECVKVEAMRGCSEVDVNEKRTAVMVRVTAAPRPRLRTAVDVVALLDVSNSMKGKLVEMKEAMQVVIDNLGPHNQLSVVLFDDKHHFGLDLKLMTTEGRLEATKVIDYWLSTGTRPRQEFNIQSVADALGTAEKILTGRSGPEGDDRRRGCIMLLSGGESKDISICSPEKLKFPVHTFGLGADHEAGSFRCIAHKNGGTYSFISNGKTKDAFKAFIGGLTSIVATSVNFRIKPEVGFDISSIVTGEHCQVPEMEGSGYKIEIADMYAGETRNFIVYLQPQSAEVSATRAEKLISVEARLPRYQQGCLLPGKEITVTHDSSLGAGSNIIAASVAAELLRVKLVTQVKDMVEGEAAAKLEVQDLQLAWKNIKVSKECHGADSTALSELEKDVAEMMTKPHGLPYMLSWLSCHEWQRATTMLHYSCAFKVRAPSRSAWELKSITNRRSCLTLVCGVVFLFALLVTLLRLGIFSGSQGLDPPIQPTALDITGQPKWSTMEDNLGDLLHRTKQGEITSFFQEKEASSHDMNQQIDQYLYMAIVHAAVLRARYDGTSVISEKLVRHQAEMYLHSILKRSKQYKLPSMKDDSLKHVAVMSQYLYSTIVQANVLVTISPPPLPVPVPDPVPDPLPVPVPDPRIDELITKLKAKNEKISDLEAQIITLRIEITTLRTQKDSCCRGAIRCRNKVKELGGSVDDEETYVVDKTVYYDQVKEISSLK